MEFRFGRRVLFQWAGVAATVLLFSTANPERGFTQEVNAQTFLTNPAAVLDKNKDGGAGLVAQIRDLAVSNPATLTSILGLLANANKDQKAAIAAGLAQAAKIVVKNNPPYATQIQQAIADTKDQDVILAYAGAAGDQPIGAGAGAGAGSAGGSGGQTNTTGGTTTGSSTASPITGDNTATGNFSYTSSVSGSSSTTGGTTSTTTLITSVSP